MGSLSFKKSKDMLEMKRFIRKQEQEISNISSVPGANYIDNSERRKDYKKYNPNQTSFIGSNVNKKAEKRHRYRQNKRIEIIIQKIKKQILKL